MTAGSEPFIMIYMLKKGLDTMKKFVSLFVVLSFVAVLLAACVGGSGSCGASSSESSSGGTPTVHMCGNNFVQSSITISKGQSLTLVDDASAGHTIANGS